MGERARTGMVSAETPIRRLTPRRGEAEAARPGLRRFSELALILLFPLGLPAQAPMGSPVRINASDLAVLERWLELVTPPQPSYRMFWCLQLQRT